MQLNFDVHSNQSQKVDISQMDSYVSFRSIIPKPKNEEAHLRHILRFYVARSLAKLGAAETYILPTIQVNDKTIQLDVVATGGSKPTNLAICEPDSVSKGTEDILESLKDLEGFEVTVLHSQYGSSGNVTEKFKEQLSSKKFRVMSVVPPPFDDVYEYDIWMFETTFRNLFGG
jgi:hypothetical protein